MNLKSLRIKSKFRCLYCAICLYPENAFCQAASLSGGRVPRVGCHSVMESPEPVSRVMPPSTICTIIINTPTNNQIATGRVDLFNLPMRRKGSGGIDTGQWRKENECATNFFQTLYTFLP